MLPEILSTIFRMLLVKRWQKVSEVSSQGIEVMEYLPKPYDLSVLRHKSIY